MTGWLVETFVTITLLMLLVLALRGPVARTFGAGWAYALWLVPAVRLVLPALPELTPDIVLPAAAAIPTVFGPATFGSAAPPPVEAGLGQWVPFMLAMWAGGAVIFLTLQWLAYRDFAHRLGATARPARPPSYGGIMTLVSQAVDGPLAMGLIERKIVVPTDFLRRYSESERRLALEHELTHHRRGDIWWNVLATLVLALNWFNPVAWAAYRAFRTDQELSCDSVVAARASPQDRWAYARALVKSASRPGVIAACSLNSSNALTRRLRMIGGHRASPGRTIGGVLALSLFTTAGFAVGKPDVIVEAPVVAAIAPAPGVPHAAPSPAAPALRPSVLSMAALVPSPRAVQIAPRTLAARADRPAAVTRPAAAAAAAGPVRGTAAPDPAAAPAPIAHAELAVALAAFEQAARHAPSGVIRLPRAALLPAPAPPRKLGSRHVHRLERRTVDRHDADETRVMVVTVTANEHEPALDAVSPRGGLHEIAVAVGGGGGTVQSDMLAQIAEAKLVLRGLRLRAPDMWQNAADGDCTH